MSGEYSLLCMYYREHCNLHSTGTSYEWELGMSTGFMAMSTGIR